MPQVLRVFGMGKDEFGALVISVLIDISDLPVATRAELRRKFQDDEAWVPDDVKDAIAAGLVILFTLHISAVEKAILRYIIENSSTPAVTKRTLLLMIINAAIKIIRVERDQDLDIDTAFSIILD